MRADDPLKIRSYKGIDYLYYPQLEHKNETLTSSASTSLRKHALQDPTTWLKRRAKMLIFHSQNFVPFAHLNQSSASRGRGSQGEKLIPIPQRTLQ